MSQTAELHVLKERIKDLEDSLGIIERGMSKKERSLRDEFAKAAMQGFIAGIEPGKEHQVTLIPALAFQLADAMLEARK